MNATGPALRTHRVARRWALATTIVGAAALVGCGDGDEGGSPASSGAPTSSADPSPTSIFAPFPNDGPAEISEIGDFQLSSAFDALEDYGAPLEDLAIVGDLVGKTYGQGDDPSQYYEDQLLVVDRARACVDELLAQEDPQRPAVVFDVDETTLSSFWMLELQDFGYDGWLENSMFTLAKSPAIEPVRDWFNDLIDLGVQPIVITGRKTTETHTSPIDGTPATFEVGSATKDNLRDEGYATGGPHAADPDAYEIHFQPADFDGDASTFKGETRDALSERFDIIGNLGDQFSDLEDGDGSQSAPCAYKLPNPFYRIGD